VPGSARPQATPAKGRRLVRPLADALGIIGGAGVGAPFAQESLQQQYDIMYAQCMAAHGNSVASFSPPPSTTPYSGDLPPYYHRPPPQAPVDAPYPGAAVLPPSYGAGRET
jgi:hypothetical protein